MSGQPLTERFANGEISLRQMYQEIGRMVAEVSSPPATARCTFAVRAMALSDPAWQSIEPKRELVFPIGEPDGNDERRWRFLPEDLALVSSEFSERAEPAPVLYRHGEDPARGGMAAGWIDRVELAEDGLYAFIRYTERALAEIKDGGWAFRSPGFDAEQDAEGYWRPRRLTEVSLVNDPAIAGMPPIKATAQPAPEPSRQPATDEAAIPAPAAEQAETKGGPQMDPLKALAAVRKALGLEDTAGPNEIMQAFASLMQNAPAPEEKEDEAAPDAEATPETPPEVPAAASVKPRIELVEDEAAVKAAREKVKALIASAVAAGKVTEAGLEGAIRFASAAPDDFAAWAETAPVVAPAAGQVVKASAADRSQKSVAERLTEKYRNEAASRRHFTQRSA